MGMSPCWVTCTKPLCSDVSFFIIWYLSQKLYIIIITQWEKISFIWFLDVYVGRLNCEMIRICCYKE